MNRVARGLYYGLQKLRGGVTRRMVARASELLEKPWTDVRRYIEGRIEANYDVGRKSGFEWLREQPLRTKSDYRDQDREVDEPAFALTTERRRTSGSTGSPFTFTRDRSMTARMDAAMWAVYRWYGIEPGDRMARFWGRPLSGLARTRRRLADVVLRQKRMSAFDVTPEDSRAFHARLRKWEPAYAYGYPSLIRKYVEHLRGVGRSGRELDLQVVITTGEILDASTRTALADFFGCPVADEYGCSESGILAFECRHGVPHMIPVACYPEVVAEERSGGAEVGPAAVTDLFGNRAPFVRYRLEDVVRRDPKSTCPCGRELPSLEVVSGREDSFIRTPDGEEIYDAVLAYSVPEGVEQFRACQTDLRTLEAKIVVAPGFEEGEVLAACRRRWAESLPSEIEIEVRPVEELAREPSGKVRYFIPYAERDRWRRREPG